MTGTNIQPGAAEYSGPALLGVAVATDTTTSLSYTAKRTSGNPSRIGYVLQADGRYYLHQIAYNDNHGVSIHSR